MRRPGLRPKPTREKSPFCLYLREGGRIPVHTVYSIYFLHPPEWLPDLLLDCPLREKNVKRLAAVWR